MDPSLVLLVQYGQQAAVVIALVVAIRKFVPKIDGPWVLVATLTVAAGMVAALKPDWIGIGPYLREVALVAGAAIATTHIADRFGNRLPPSTETVKAAEVAAVKAELRAATGTMDPKVVEQAAKEVADESPPPPPTPGEVNVAAMRAAIKDAEAERSKPGPSKGQ